MSATITPYAADQYEFDRPSNTVTGLSVVIPVYNEERAIVQTVDQIRHCLDMADVDFEIITVNDGSSDSTYSILRTLPGIRVLHHPVNLGYGASLKTGIRHAKHPLIAIIDADGSYPIERLPDLVHLAEDADMVVGARTGDDVQYSKLRSIPKWFLKHFAEWMTRRPIPDLNSGMRVFRKPAVERFLNILPDGFSFTTTITLAMLTNRYVVHYEPINYHQRVGKSKIKPIRDTINFVQLILRTGMYFAPLRVFLPVSAIFMLGFGITFLQDLIRGDLTERTLLLLVGATQLAMFSLLADMIDKRNP